MLRDAACWRPVVPRVKRLRNYVRYYCSIGGIIGGGAYQKLVIREADAHLRRAQNKGQSRKKPLTLAGRRDSSRSNDNSMWRLADNSEL